MQFAFVLVFVHLGTRKVFATPATLHPMSEWMQQQSRNVKMWAEEQGIEIQYLLHDHDVKFTESFDAAFERDDGGVVKTPIMAPVANCFIESWIGSFKRECLNHFFCFGTGHLDYIVSEYVQYQNQFRPHQGLGNVTIPNRGANPVSNGDADIIGKVDCQEGLGGMLKHYYRQAA